MEVENPQTNGCYLRDVDSEKEPESEASAKETIFVANPADDERLHLRDLEKQREGMRSELARTALWAYALLLTAMLLLGIAIFVWTDKPIDQFIALSVLLSPVHGIVGAIIGFYFNERLLPHPRN